jgi:hypothetical protein
VLKDVGRALTTGEWSVESDNDRVLPGHNPELAGKQAECDGGGPIWGTKYAGRQEFSGTLTGEYIDHGTPPWRWYLMVDLTRKPDNYPDQSVWCEADSVFLLDDPSRLLGPGSESE